MTAISHLKTFPRQKVPFSQKGKKWGIKNIEAGIAISFFDSQQGSKGTGSGVRSPFNAKRVNYDLAAGIMDDADLEKAFNPMGIKGVEFPAKTQNYPIEIPKINVLKGEETKRSFDWRVRTVNEDAFSDKENAKLEQLWSVIMDELQDSASDEAKVEKRIKELGKYFNYEYQDIHELTASRALNYLWYEQKLKQTFSAGFYDVLIAAEEIYCIDKIAGEPIVRRCNPLNISTLRSGESHKIEDSDIIIEDGFFPVGSVIDDYYEDLTSSQITGIEEGREINRAAGGVVFSGPVDQEQNTYQLGNAQIISVDSGQDNAFGGSFDSDGNVRVIRVVWRSLRKIGDLTYFDENGDEMHEVVDETHKIDEERGEKIKWEWVNEWWTGTRIGKDIYVRIEALPRYGSHFSNASICKPPYVGTVYSINSQTSVSLYDRIKPYKYLYNVFMRRALLSAARDKGVLPEMDMARVPEGWTPELWFMYAEQNGYFVVDSFKEGTKGVATGKLAANMGQVGNRTYDLRNSDAVVQNLQAAQMAKAELGEVAGISPAREGATQSRETLGGQQLSIQASSFITEEYFALHDSTKIRVMEMLLEVAQEAWRGNKRKLEYIDDGMMSVMFELDGTEFAESEYGIYFSDGSSDASLVETIRALAQASIQNGQATLADLIDVFRETRSVSSMVRKLERAEETRDAKLQEQQQQAQEGAMKVEQVKMSVKQAELDSKERIEAAKIENQQIIEKMRIDAGIVGNFFTGVNDTNKNLIDDNVEIEKQELMNESKEKEIASKEEEAEAQRKFDAKENEKNRKSAEKISKNRKPSK